MNNHEFWDLIDNSKKKIKFDSNNPFIIQYEALLEQMQQYSSSDIMQFYYIFRKKLYQAIEDDYLVPILFIINGGNISNNKYYDFVSWIISQGKNIYENILKNPDYISSILEYKQAVPLFGPQYDIFNHLVPLAAIEAYKIVSGRNFEIAEIDALQYPQEFIDTLENEKGINVANLLESNYDSWSAPDKMKILKDHYPISFDKFGKWMVNLFGDFRPSTPENQESFIKLVKDQVKEWKNDPNEPPVVMKTTLVKEIVKVSCPHCTIKINKEEEICPYCKNSTFSGEMKVLQSESEDIKLLEQKIGVSIPMVTILKPRNSGYTSDGSHVVGLSFSEKGLTNLPKELNNLKYLQFIELRFNQLKSLPKFFGNFDHLKHLFLGYNQLTSLPKTLGNLKSLEMLNLEFNKLNSLPETIGDLINLKYLDLGVNPLKSLPNSLGKLVNLQKLMISHTDLKSLPDALGKIMNLQELYLSQNYKLKTLPKTIGNLINLHTLSLSLNKLTNLPETIGNLINLKKLSLEDNQLKTLPETLGNLTHLEKLELHRNKLNSFPKSIGQLQNLKELTLFKNQLKYLPNTIGILNKLQQLEIYENQLDSIPETIGYLSNLQKLSLRSNKLKSLPESIGNLSNLKILDLRSNQLSNLPETMTNLTNLKVLALQDNNINKESLSIEQQQWLIDLNRKNCKIHGIHGI